MRPRALVALAVGALGLLELGLQAYFSRRPPTPADWRAARAPIEALRQPGDAVIIAPWWVEPHARKALGEGLLPLRDLARPDETRYRRVVEIRALGERTPSLLGWAPIREQRLGPSLSAFVLENPSPVVVRYDFTDSVEAGLARVALISALESKPCPFRERELVAAPGLFGHPAMPPRRHACGPQPWQSVGVTVQDDRLYRARRCIWAPPPGGLETLQIRFADVPLGQEIRGHMGVHATLDREARGAPIDLEVLVGDEPVGRVTYQDGQSWAPFSFSLGPRAGEDHREVTFRVSCRESADRQFCFEADTRSPGPR
jgi:hypothetical protein